VSEEQKLGMHNVSVLWTPEEKYGEKQALLSLC
jgi:hypothetical protein